MLIALWTGLALAGGGGVYVELDPGAAATSSTDSLSRGWSGALELGAYAGPYRGSMRYGRYTRAGFRLSWIGVELERGGDLIHQVQPLFTIGKGTDVVDAGLFWTVGAGPVAVVYPRVGRVDYGGGARGTIGAAYNAGRSFGVGLRFEGGADMLYRVDEGRIDLTLTAGVSLFVLLRAPLWTPRDPYEDTTP